LRKKKALWAGPIDPTRLARSPATLVGPSFLPPPTRVLSSPRLLPVKTLASPRLEPPPFVCEGVPPAARSFRGGAAMVWFQCEDCGENLKKPKLAGHFRSCYASKVSTTPTPVPLFRSLFWTDRWRRGLQVVDSLVVLRGGSYHASIAASSSARTPCRGTPSASPRPYVPLLVSPCCSVQFLIDLCNSNVVTCLTSQLVGIV